MSWRSSGVQLSSFLLSAPYGSSAQLKPGTMVGALQVSCTCDKQAMQGAYNAFNDVYM